MSGLDSIRGQARAVEVLKAAVAAEKVHHAYLFEGPEGVGKASCARALAMALNCEQRRVSGCGTCESCRKIERGNHPDLIVFDMTPKGLTERVRELIGVVGFRPHEGRARVVLLDPADDLAGPQERAEPANVLLKTLEEPPPQTHFVLVTAQPKRLPVTVRSRCQRLRFLPLEDAVIEEALIARRISPTVARTAAAQAAGSLGRALAEAEAAGDENAPQPRAVVETLVRAARRGEAKAIFDAAAELPDREQAQVALTVLWTVLRDAVLVREGVSRGRVSAERADFASQLFGDRPTAALLRALRATGEAVQALKGNVAPSLAVEHLLLELAYGRPIA